MRYIFFVILNNVRQKRVDCGVLVSRNLDVFARISEVTRNLNDQMTEHRSVSKYITSYIISGKYRKKKKY